MYVSRLSGPDGADAGSAGDLVWDQIENAIRQLNGIDRTEVFIGSEAEVPHLGIGGGGGRYVVFASYDNRTFYTALQPGARKRRVWLVTGGQGGLFSENRVVDFDTALRAARSFAERDELDPSVEWTTEMDQPGDQWDEEWDPEAEPDDPDR